MKAQPVKALRTILLAIAAALAGCGGGYGGGGSGGGGAASISMSIAPTTITLGASATITWSSNGSQCIAGGAWSGSKSGDGSQSVTPTATGTLTYTLVCSGGGYGNSQTGTATLTVNAALASTFTGEACCMGAEKFPVEGITSESGELRFLGLDRHFVAKSGEPTAEFETCDTCLAGALVNDQLAIDPSSLELRSRPSDSAALEGQYTTHLASGYTLTVSIDAAGRLTGIDTRGCRFDGQTRARTPASRVVDVELEVSACGSSDGRYTGNAALFSATESKPARLLLSASNAKSAIGWQLSR